MRGENHNNGRKIITLASGAWSKAWQARPHLAWPGLPRSWPGSPGKRGLEKPGKPSQGQGFEVSLAIEAWLFWPHRKIGRHFMAFPARKPEDGKAKNSWQCSTSDSNKKCRNNFFTIFLPFYCYDN